MHSDYFMRMIAQFMQALAEVMRLRKSGKADEALGQIQFLSQRFLNVDFSSLINFSPQQLVDHFKGDEERSLVCAELLYETALLCEAQKNEVAAKRLKTLALYLYISTKQPLTAEYRSKIESLLASLDASALPDEVKMQLKIYKTTHS